MSVVSTNQPTGGDAQQDPLPAERQFFTALLAADGPALAAVLTDDFVLVDVMQGAEIPGAALVSAVASRQLIFDGVDVLESRVRLYGSTAVVVGRTQMHGRAGDVQWSARSRYTHVYVQQDGRWRLASAQGTLIASG
jgi:ketosteroid isomerase-like protein